MEVFTNYYTRPSIHRQRSSLLGSITEQIRRDGITLTSATQTAEAAHKAIARVHFADFSKNGGSEKFYYT
jgi:hypothetical protein